MALRDRPDHDRGVQDVVVVREVAGRHLVDACVGQLQPVRTAQLGGRGAEGSGGSCRVFFEAEGVGGLFERRVLAGFVGGSVRGSCGGHFELACCPQGCQR
ncbi:hypothetical protein GCM10010424_73520 [Streptomyces lienomycini]